MNKKFSLDEIKQAFKEVEKWTPSDIDEDPEGALNAFSDFSYAVENFYNELDAHWRQAQREQAYFDHRNPV